MKERLIVPELWKIKESVINKMLLEQLMEGLKTSERKLIKMRYFENMTQMQVAGVLGISQVQVSRTEKKILQGMRKNLEPCKERKV